MMKRLNPGVSAAILAAVLFGASTPINKWLLETTGPVMLAGLLYLGSGLGLFSWQALQSRRRGEGTGEARLRRADFPWLAGAILLGGVLAPVLLLFGLSATSPSAGSLLLNLEGVFTALVAWFVFKENFDRRIALGMGAILAGGLLVSWQGTPNGEGWQGAWLIGAACFCWALDNNLTRKISTADPVQIAAWKGAVAGVVNVALALSLGTHFPPLRTVLAAGLLGAVSYGLSLTCFILALRQIGTARSGAYFSTAPFVGAVLSLIIFPEWPTWTLLGAAVLMGLGVWLHLTEKHGHVHNHKMLDHEHLHTHDAHHQHVHLATDPVGEPHNHPHRHAPLRHAHPHFPDVHHQHDH